MSANPAGRNRRQDVSVPTPPARGRSRWLSGLLSLAGALLAAYFLVFQGVVILYAGMAARAISNLSRPDLVRVEGTGAMIAAGAVMLVSGVCLFVGLLVLGLRGLSGRPHPRRHNVLLFVLVSAGLIGLTALIARRATAPAPVPASHAGLEGLWHPSASDKHAYRFNPDGSVDAWWSALGGGRFGSWTRVGQTVTVRTIRNWHFVGTLSAGTITGTMYETDSGKVIGAETWVRPVAP
jgi:hypothetical protein